MHPFLWLSLNMCRGGGAAQEFSPADLNPELWLASDEGAYADDGTTLAVDDDPVQQWQDQSGNGRHANQVTEGNRPLFKTGVLNGQPVIRFDNVDDFIGVDLASAITQPTTVLIVAKLSDTSGQQLFGGEAGAFQEIYSGGGGVWNINAGNQVNGGVANTNSNLYEIVFNGASSELLVNGSTLSSGNAGSNSMGAARLGDVVSVGSSKLGGDVAELVVVSSLLSEGDRDSFYNYVSDKYGITLS